MLISLSDVFAGPTINWQYLNNINRRCENVCARRVLKACVRWTERCNLRGGIYWKKRHKRIVKKAFNLISQRIGSNRILSCVKKHTREVSISRNPRIRSNYLSKLSYDDLLSLSVARQWPKIYIKAYSASGNTLGRALVERNLWGEYKTLTWYSNKKITINLNLKRMDETLRNYGENAAVEDFSGTIIHEILHQMGHVHPVNDYRSGYFVSVGDCIASNGNSARNSGFSLRGRHWYIAD